MACHQEIFTELNADVAEFCPLDPCTAWLAVGTYQLDETTQQRHGRLYLHQLDQALQQQQQQPSASPRLVQLATVDLPGIFDLQWACLPSLSTPPAIGLALADGTLRIVTVLQSGDDDDDDDDASGADQPQQEQQQRRPACCLQDVASCQAVVSGMALSLAWSPRQQEPGPEPQRAALSSSSGTVSIVQVPESGLTPLAEWAAHELEAWMAAWDQHQPDVLYSGADDCSFKGWDTRALHTGSSPASPTSPSQAESPQQAPIFCNRRAHGAGVCCISSHPRRPHCLATGSYDEAVRLWDTRMLHRPLETCQVSTGGGVWRLKWHPRDDSLLLAACMYNGFALVQADASFDGLQVVEEYKAHENIAYGADWYRGQQHATTSEEDAVSDVEVAAEQQHGASLAAPRPELAASAADIVATCSFYDRRLHLWSPHYRSQQCG